jgi:hypothetical protein
MTASPSETARSSVRYQIPTHLNVPDKIAIPLLGITFHVTIRQGLILLLGWSTAFNLWRHLERLSAFGVPGLLCRLFFPLLLALATFIIATIQIGGRYLEEWGVLVLRYRRNPMVSLWRPIDCVSGENKKPSLPEKLEMQEMSEEEEGDRWL